jgi:hypothetical protein
VGVGQTDEKGFCERERFQFGVISEFRATAAGRFDDDVHGAVLGKGRQVDEIRHDGCPRVLMIGAVQKKVRRTDVRNKRFCVE